MADTRQNVDLPSNTWVNLYVETDISVGTKIRVENTGKSDVYVSVSATEPTLNDDEYNVLDRDNGVRLVNSAGDTGAWALSPNGDGKINVSVATGEGFHPEVGVTSVPADQAQMINTDGDIVPAAATQFLDNIAFVDHFGQAIVGELKSDISVNFAYGVVDTDFDLKTPVTAGDGVITAVDGYIQSSSTTGSANVESRDSLRYSNGRGFFIYGTASFEGLGLGWAGGFDGDSLHDGFPLRYNGTTDILEFGYLEQGVFTDQVVVDHVALGLDLTKLNIWAVIGGFLGVANPTLLVKLDTWKVAAVIKTEGRLTEPHVRLPAFPMAVRSEGDMTVKSGSWHAGTIGDAANVQDRGFSYPSQPFSNVGGGNEIASPRGRLTLSGSGVHTVFTLHSKDLYNGLPNKVRADVVNVSVLIVPNGAGEGVVQCQLLGNVQNFTVAPVYNDIAPSSVLDIDDVADDQSVGRYNPANPSGFLVGEPLNLPYVGGQGNNSSQFGQEATLVQELQLDGIAGETLTLVARDIGANGPDLYWFITWIERQI